MVRRHKVKIAKLLRHRNDHCEKNVRDTLDFLQWSGALLRTALASSNPEKSTKSEKPEEMI
jgi:hypothetical protein